MNIKSILLGSTIAISSILGISVPEAQATSCFNGRGYTMCYDHISSNGNYNKWFVGIENAYTQEFMTVTCYGKSVSTWNSKGGFNQSEAQNLAEVFCSM